jgi:hypothetical protein
MCLWKNCPKCCPNHVLSKLVHNFQRGNVSYIQVL